MSNAQRMLDATAGLTRAFDEINEYGLAGDCTVGLASKALEDTFRHYDAIADRAAGISAVPEIFGKLANDEVTRSPCYAVTHSLHSVNSAKIYI